MKPRVAVFKFASCDGCQLQFLNAEDELLKLATEVDFVISLRLGPAPWLVLTISPSWKAVSRPRTTRAE